jgi:hypothetical protein
MGLSDVSVLPIYFTKGHNRDAGWHREAKCLGASADPGHPFYRAWYADERKPFVMSDGTTVPGAEMAAHALNECGMCPAQWDCARWAVEVHEDYGIWAMRWDDLKWLRSQSDVFNIIESARAKHRTVQVTVVQLRARRTQAASTIPA